MHYTVVIVGAGPAGVSAAYHLKKNNIDCCLIDKSKFPRFKLCGGLITEKTLILLNNYGFSDFNKIIKDKINKVNILSNGKNVITTETTKYFNLVDRMEFDNWFLEKYIEIGGIALLGKRVSKINLDQKELVVDNTNITFDYVIAADGAKGISSKIINREPLKYAFGLETDIDTNLCDNDKHSIDLDVSIAKNGYYWRFPKNNKTTLGFAFSFDKDIDYSELSRKLLPDNCVIRGAFLPYGNRIKVVSDKRGMLLVGDAAGFVDAITGEGTYYAIKSGEIAANAIMTNSPIEEYIKNTLYICKEVNKSWKFISKFYKFRYIILRLIPNHKKFFSFICDYQVSTQKCDFSIIKMALLYKKHKQNNN
ncbi:hypothetical protein HMPREF9628_01446 [Peptoanaerobacter stomatis]|uniref:FAD-binding domain-containing protein n=1 Tax=Peptoanaerobacter stomatis TaxID=796937 RepID=G9XBS9_9FIRM|nr:geranylgeranyl reductase family protein [Peptoanaerobacter stomatis]EHL19634.1 hypothetical protein HMPREF9628_01446 [Peptoanaerobacter stomatis]